MSDDITLDIEEKQLPAAELSVQARAKGGATGETGLFHAMARAGNIMPPWWSTNRDMELRKFWRNCDHFAGAAHTISAKLAAVPFRVMPRDPEVKGHWKQAEMYQAMLAEGSEFYQGYDAWFTKFAQDLWTQDNGAFSEVIGDGPSDGPIRGPAVGLANLDAARCTRTRDPEYPVIFQDIDGTRYKFHHSRVMYASQLPSTAAQMNGVGFCWLSRAMNSAQSLVDDMIYKQEKIGSRPLRAIIYGSGAPTDLVVEAVQEASEAASNAGLTRFSKLPVLMNESGINQLALGVLDLASLPDGFNFETDVTLGMYAIALAGAFPPRWLWPATSTGATKADAMLQHTAMSVSGAAQHLKLIQTLLAGSEHGSKHMAGKFLPPHLKLIFDFQDDEQDRAQAEIRDKRSERHQRDMAAGTITVRVAREQMLADGDITEAQFNEMEVWDGRTPEGDDISLLFYGDNEWLQGIDPDKPDMAAVEERWKEAKRAIVQAVNVNKKRAAKLAVAALQWLLEQGEEEDQPPEPASDEGPDLDQAQDGEAPEVGEEMDEDEERLPSEEKAHKPERVQLRCPIPGCDGMVADVYADHKGLAVCVACGATFDPSIEVGYGRGL